MKITGREGGRGEQETMVKWICSFLKNEPYLEKYKNCNRYERLGGDRREKKWLAIF